MTLVPGVGSGCGMPGIRYDAVSIGLKLLGGDPRKSRRGVASAGLTGASMVPTTAVADEDGVEVAPYNAQLESSDTVVGTGTGKRDPCHGSCC